MLHCSGNRLLCTDVLYCNYLLNFLSVQWKDGDVVNAPILTDCPLNIECTVTESLKPGTHELFIAKVEKVHCLEEYLGATEKIDWSKIGIK